MKTGTKIVVVLALLTLCNACLADELYVPGQYPTIQAAIDDSNDGDIIIVADGTYTGEGNRDIDFLGKAITVRSVNGPNNCIIDCNGTATDAHRGFYFRNRENRNSVVNGLTIINGYAPGSRPRDVGGGIFCWAQSAPTIANCIIKGNRAYWGGGISCTGSSPVISNCVISENSAFSMGGGIFLWGSSPTIKNCVISNNSKTGIECSGSNSIIKNCIISKNLGNGITSPYMSNPTISNCTIIENSTYGVECRTGGRPTITNCIIWNHAREIYIWGSNIPKPTVSYSDIQGGKKAILIRHTGKLVWAQGNIDADPCFVNTDFNDYYLLPESPCIDAGDPNFIPEPNETDIEGNPRTLDGDEDGIAVVDMGAYEYEPLIEAQMQLTPQTLNCSGKGKWVKAHITIAEGFYPEDVDVNEPAIAYPMEAESEYITVAGGDKGPVRIEVVFGREAFCDSITDDYLDVTVIGSLTTGEYFSGTDTIKIRKR